MMSDERPMDDATRRLLEDFVEAAKRLQPIGEPPSGLARWLDFRVNVGTLLTVIVLIGGGGLAIRDQVQSALVASAHNAAEISRVEADSRARDTQIEIELKDRFRDHMQYQHSKRGARVEPDTDVYLEHWPPLHLGMRP